MIWSMLVQGKGVEEQAAIKETVDSLNGLDHPELTVRSNKEPAMFAFRNARIRKKKERGGG